MSADHAAWHGRRLSRAGVAVACVLCVLLLPGAAVADWPVYGHDLANSRNAPLAGPAPSQVASAAQAWAFKSPTGDFTGTPVVTGGVLVAGDNGGVVYALDAVTGKVLWSTDVGQPITGTAAIDRRAPGGPAVYVPVAQPGSPRLLALSLSNGATRWDTVLTNQPQSSVFGSPVFFHGSVYIGTSGPNNDDSHARGSVVAVDQATGSIRWQTFTVPPQSDGAAVWSTPAIDPATGRMYVGTGNNYHEPTTDTEDSMLALDTATGQILGHFQATSNDVFAADNPAGPDFDFGASANLFTSPSGEPLVGEGQKSGIYWALDRATMRPVWSTTAGPGGVLGGILGSTAFDGTRIYGADTLTGQVFAIARAGSMPWTSLDSGVVHLSPTSVAHGVLYTVDPAGLLVARDPATGTVLARQPLGGPSFGGVSAAGTAIYVAVGTGPPPQPAPQQDGSGSIVAFGDTSHSGGSLAHGSAVHRQTSHSNR
jgi:polyvinyl alcohol dehydrogenase (cytochrome)